MKHEIPKLLNLEKFYQISAKYLVLLDSNNNSSHTCWRKSQVFPSDDERGAEANFDAELSDPRETSMLINEISLQSNTALTLCIMYEAEENSTKKEESSRHT